jgi:ATP-dependent DNA helicase RecG
MEILMLCEKPVGRHYIQARLGLKDREHFRKTYLLPAINAGLIEMTIPDKPSSRLQKYRLTLAGVKYLKEQDKKKE